MRTPVETVRRCPQIGRQSRINAQSAPHCGTGVGHEGYCERIVCFGFADRLHQQQQRPTTREKHHGGRAAGWHDGGLSGRYEASLPVRVRIARGGRRRPRGCRKSSCGCRSSQPLYAPPELRRENDTVDANGYARLLQNLGNPGVARVGSGIRIP